MNKNRLVKYTSYMLACTMLLNGFCVASSKKNNKNIFVNNTNYDNYLKDNTISKSEDDIKREEDFKKIFLNLNQKLKDDLLENINIDNFKEEDNQEFIKSVIKKFLKENKTCARNIKIHNNYIEIYNNNFSYNLYNFTNEYDEFKISFPFEYTITYIPAIRNLIIEDDLNKEYETIILDEESVLNVAKIFNSSCVSYQELRYRINNLIRGLDPFTYNEKDLNEEEKVFKDKIINYLNNKTKNNINNCEYLDILNNLLDDNYNINSILDSYIRYSLSYGNHFKLNENNVLISQNNTEKIILNKNSLNISNDNMNFNMQFLNYLDSISKIELKSEISEYPGLNAISLTYDSHNSTLKINISIWSIENNYSIVINNYNDYEKIIDFYFNFKNNYQAEDIFVFYYNLAYNEDLNNRDNAIQKLENIIVDSTIKDEKNMQQMMHIRDYYLNCLEYLPVCNDEESYDELVKKLTTGTDNHYIESYSSWYLKKVVNEKYKISSFLDIILASKELDEYKETISIYKNKLDIYRGSNNLEIVSKHNAYGDLVSDIYKLTISDELKQNTIIFNTIEYDPLKHTVKYNIGTHENTFLIDGQDEELVLQFMANFTYNTKIRKLYNLLNRISKGEDAFINDLTHLGLTLSRI